MPSSAQFYKQHEELLEIAQELAATLNAAELAKDGTKARAVLTRLIGVLSVHLSMEDRVLYPTLAKSSNDAVRETATRFAKEMGGIGEAVAAYKTKWSTATRIQEGAEDFVNETKGIIQALGGRIDRENKELYPLMDRAS